MGSPASRISSNVTHLTTRPLSTSRQGIIRFANAIVLQCLSFQRLEPPLASRGTEGGILKSSLVRACGNPPYPPLQRGDTGKPSGLLDHRMTGLRVSPVCLRKSPDR